jgi:cell division protein FtsB
MSDHPDADRFAKEWGGQKYTLEQTGNVGYAFEPEALEKLQAEYARLKDDNDTLDQQVQQLTDELQEQYGWAR